jgi:small GTP-binding protein
MQEHKILLIGASGSGKSALLEKWHKETFSSEERPTIGLDFTSKKLFIDGQPVGLKVCDVPGVRNPLQALHHISMVLKQS